MVRLKTKDGESYEAQIWEWNTEEEYFTLVVPDGPEKITFDEVESGTIKDRFSSKGVEEKDLLDYIEEKKQRLEDVGD